MTSVQSEKPENVSLEEVFRNVVDKSNNIQIRLDTLRELILKDLKLKVDHLSDSHLNSLPYMLMSYIKKWPGWDKRLEYENGSLDFESWYKRFRQYVFYKMALLISKTLTNVASDLEQETKKVKTVSNSTQLSNRATFANFSVDIAGPAALLSNLVFWGFEDSISVEEHSDRPWMSLSAEQLLNYPYVEVEFNSPELSFKRTFEPRISRYISGCADLVYEKPKFILGKHRINNTTSKFIFPVSLLEQYIELYKQTLLAQVSEPQLEEVSVILDQFYKDMLDINKNNCAAENRQTAFNIGKNMFKRSKKISNEQTESIPGPSVIFNEIFLPKLISSFRYFTGLQKYTLEGKRMVSISENGSLIMMKFKPIISYKCTYCKLKFEGPHGQTKILVHLEKTHKREQPLLCLLCKKSFEVTDLAKQRWKCECQK